MMQTAGMLSLLAGRSPGLASSCSVCNQGEAQVTNQLYYRTLGWNMLTGKELSQISVLQPLHKLESSISEITAAHDDSPRLSEGGSG